MLCPCAPLRLPGFSKLPLETRHILRVETRLLCGVNPHKHLPCPQHTAFPPQSDPSRAEVLQAVAPQPLAPRAFAVGFQDTGKSNRLQ